MKFNCGPTPEEREQQRIQDWFASREWHDWFAWFPVRIGPNDCRWLETVQRRNTFDPARGWRHNYDEWKWEYRAC